MKTESASKHCEVIVVTFIVLSAIIFSNTFLYGEEVPGVTDKSIKIGLILDQTGPAADVLVPTTQGIKSYFRHINDQGGIYGRKIFAQVEDDRYSIPLAITAFKKLVFKDQVFALIGPTSTGAFNVLSRHIERQKLPFMSAIMPEITIKPFKKYVFIFADIYPNQMKVLLDYILKDLNPNEPRIALVYPDNETGKVDTESALRKLKSCDLSPVSQEILNPGSLDAGSQVMSLRRKKASHVVLCGFLPQSAAVLLRELKKYGLDTPVFGSFAACVEEVIRMAGDSSKRFYAVNHTSSWYDEGPGVAKMRKITLQYMPGTEKPFRGKIYTHGWLGARVMIEILKKTNKDLNRDKFIRAMESIKDLDTGGLCGPISFSPTNHKGGNTWKIFKADPGTRKFIPMTEWRRSD